MFNIEDNMSIFKQVANTPKEACKSIGAGRLKGMTDINPMWRIKTLTEVFGACGFGWKVRVIDRQIMESEDAYNASKIIVLTLALNVKSGDTWSDDIIGVGGSTLIAKENRGAYISDEAEKMAFTDALGSCCKLLGFSSDIYYAKDRTKYDSDSSAEFDKKSEVDPSLKGKIDEIKSLVSKFIELGASRLEVADVIKSKYVVNGTPSAKYDSIKDVAVADGVIEVIKEAILKIEKEKE